MVPTPIKHSECFVRIQRVGLYKASIMEARVYKSLDVSHSLWDFVALHSYLVSSIFLSALGFPVFPFHLHCHQHWISASNLNSVVCICTLIRLDEERESSLSLPNPPSGIESPPNLLSDIFTLFIVFQTGFHSVNLADLELTMTTRMVLKSQRSACLHFPSSGIKGVYHGLAWFSDLEKQNKTKQNSDSHEVYWLGCAQGCSCGRAEIAL